MSNRMRRFWVKLHLSTTRSGFVPSTSDFYIFQFYILCLIFYRNQYFLFHILHFGSGFVPSISTFTFCTASKDDGTNLISKRCIFCNWVIICIAHTGLLNFHFCSYCGLGALITRLDLRKEKITFGNIAKYNTVYS